ncbi:hypothetical protein NONO_c60910 [Nocardia nova SH22a]|uniref:Transmembrane protein n=1 Tax=Nocardia nova SH22a TaxID=1415166 RepID=W5TNQ2_9NOCA|nr:hypothetical protein [Nocardia nova]AHH20867.1 hypothetical protein NONO_c60910 [Nocardia nova SH22a]
MRPLFEWLGRALDIESVRHYQVVVYAAVFGAGVQGLVLRETPNAVGQQIGPCFQFFWLGLLVLCPVLTFLGMWVERRHIAGLWLQVAGDAGVSFALLAYTAAIGHATFAGRATFAMWIALALSVCAFALVIRGVRKLRTVSRIVRKLEVDE